MLLINDRGHQLIFGTVNFIISALIMHYVILYSRYRKSFVSRRIVHVDGENGIIEMPNDPNENEIDFETTMVIKKQAGIRTAKYWYYSCVGIMVVVSGWFAYYVFKIHANLFRDYTTDIAVLKQLH